MVARRITHAAVLSAAVSAVVVALTLGPITARAAEGAKGQHDTGKMPSSMAQLMNMDPEQCMKMMDKEHDGHVTKQEFMRFQEMLWEKMDRNRDGRADLAEFTDAG